MKRTVVSILPILVILCAFGCTKHRPREKEMEALKLLGDAEDYGRPQLGYGILADCGADQETVEEAERIVSNWLRERGPFKLEQPIVPGLPEVAAKLSVLAKQCTKLNLLLRTTKHPEITKIREILGAEDRIENTGMSVNGKALTLHHYGWIQFWVMENKVDRLLLNFKNSGY